MASPLVMGLGRTNPAFESWCAVMRNSSGKVFQDKFCQWAQMEPNRDQVQQHLVSELCQALVCMRRNLLYFQDWRHSLNTKEAQVTFAAEVERKRYIQCLRTLELFGIPLLVVLTQTARIEIRQIFEGGQWIDASLSTYPVHEHMSKTPHLSSTSSASQQDLIFRKCLAPLNASQDPLDVCVPLKRIRRQDYICFLPDMSDPIGGKKLRTQFLFWDLSASPPPGVTLPKGVKQG